MIVWKCTDKEMDVITKIADRASKMVAKTGRLYKTIGAVMDIAATHLNGCPLNLEGLLVADDFNFAHDVLGIREHLDRRTGKLKDCFVPRYARGKEYVRVIKGQA